MSGLFSINVQEARGLVAVPAGIDDLAVVMGCSSSGSGLSPFFLSGAAAVQQLGYGDAVDTLCQIIEQRGTQASKRPAAFYSLPVSTNGSYDTIDDAGVTGTSAVTTDAGTHPFGTYDAQIRVVKGCTIGVTGGTLQWSLDGGRNWSNVVALGVATHYTIPNSNVRFNFAAGTLVAGDIAKVRTHGPAPSTSDIDAAFVALAASTAFFGLIVLDFDCSASVAAHVTTGLDALKAAGKGATALCRTRLPDYENAETEAAWATSVEADYANFHDSRILVRAAYGLVTDAMTTRQYLRATLQQFAADCVRVGRANWPCAPADAGTGLSGEPNVSLVDANGARVGHDEGPRGSVTGLSNDALGNRFSCEMRIPNPAVREAVFNTVPWTMAAADERIRNLMARRLANAIERVTVAAGLPTLGSKVFYTKTGPTSGVLTPASRKAIQGSIFQAVSSEFSDEISNAADASIDTGLVQVSPTVAISGGNLVKVSVTVAPNIGGFVLALDPITLAIQE